MVQAGTHALIWYQAAFTRGVPGAMKGHLIGERCRDDQIQHINGSEMGHIYLQFGTGTVCNLHGLYTVSQ